jgi:hypothetical protein
LRILILHIRFWGGSKDVDVGGHQREEDTPIPLLATPWLLPWRSVGEGKFDLLSQFRDTNLRVLEISNRFLYELLLVYS